MSVPLRLSSLSLNLSLRSGLTPPGARYVARLRRVVLFRMPVRSRARAEAPQAGIGFTARPAHTPHPCCAALLMRTRGSLRSSRTAPHPPRAETPNKVPMRACAPPAHARHPPTRAAARNPTLPQTPSASTRGVLVSTPRAVLCPPPTNARARGRAPSALPPWPPPPARARATPRAHLLRLRLTRPARRPPPPPRPPPCPSTCRSP